MNLLCPHACALTQADSSGTHHCLHWCQGTRRGGQRPQHDDNDDDDDGGCFDIIPKSRKSTWQNVRKKISNSFLAAMHTPAVFCD
jgi:hypothetical protein